jgi:DNA-directed RNA polymerase subunit beta'
MTQGIKRIEQLFEVRNPKKPAVIAPFDGTVTVEESPKKVEVVILSDPQPKTYIIKEAYVCEVKKNMKLEKGGVYAVKGRSKLKVKEAGKVLEVHKDYIVFGVEDEARKKLAIGTSLKVKPGAQVFK